MTRLFYYSAYIIGLLGYAVLPIFALKLAYGYCQITFLLLLAKELGWFKNKIPTVFSTPSKTLFNLLTAFQEPVELVTNYVRQKKSLMVSTMLIIVLLPSECLILTQLGAIYLMSLFVYQLAVLCIKDPELLLQHLTRFKPGDEHRESLTKLEHMQMKLVTMISLSMVTFIPMSYYQGVSLFMLVACTYPLVGRLLSKIVDVLFKSLARTGVDKKPAEAVIGVASLFILLLNYKYEQYILNFLCILYCSLLLGQTGSHFYNAPPKGRVESSNALIDLFYHPHLILAFWSLALFYEVTSLVYVPRLLFIASATFLGTKESIAPSVDPDTVKSPVDQIAIPANA